MYSFLSRVFVDSWGKNQGIEITEPNYQISDLACVKFQSICSPAHTTSYLVAALNRSLQIKLSSSSSTWKNSRNSKIVFHGSRHTKRIDASGGFLLEKSALGYNAWGKGIYTTTKAGYSMESFTSCTRRSFRTVSVFCTLFFWRG